MRRNTSEVLSRRISAAMGRIECDLLLKNVTYLDVFTCTWKTGELAIADGALVALESGLRARREMDLSGKFVVPGFIDAHVHIESSLMVPREFQRAVLPRGTTAAICDPHELANVQGVAGIEFFLKAAETLQLDLRVMLSSCVPATHMETNGGGTISNAELAPLARHPRALGLAEMMNFPGVLAGDPSILEKLTSFAGRSIDGHAPLLSGRELSAYVSAGISSCHECSEKTEALEKISKGMSVWMREGSVAKDLAELVPLLTLQTSTSMGFCTDDRNPLDIATEGHIDFLIREAIRLGVPSEVAYRTASWSPARHYGLTSGLSRQGAIAPGFLADLVILDDRESCAIQAVLKSGEWVSEMGLERSVPPSTSTWNSIRAVTPAEEELRGPSGRVHVIGVQHGRILTDHLIMNHDDPGVARISVLERYGGGRKPANGYTFGFGRLQGAIASSVGHDSHNLAVVGTNTAAMRCALAALIEVGGGFCVVQGNRVAARLPLPLGGLMSDRAAEEIQAEMIRLKEAAREIGCVLPEPFLQLAFLSLPVIPKLKLTDHGLVDVDAFRLIDVRV